MFDDFDGPAGAPPSERFWTFEAGGSWPGNDFDERALPVTMLIDWVRATVPPWPTTQR